MLPPSNEQRRWRKAPKRRRGIGQAISKRPDNPDKKIAIAAWGVILAAVAVSFVIIAAVTATMG